MDGEWTDHIYSGPDRFFPAVLPGSNRSRLPIGAEAHCVGLHYVVVFYKTLAKAPILHFPFILKMPSNSESTLATTASTLISLAAARHSTFSSSSSSSFSFF